MKKVILLLPVLLLNFCLVLAQDAYERKVFVSSSGDSLNYRLLERCRLERNIRWSCFYMELEKGVMIMKNS